MTVDHERRCERRKKIETTEGKGDIDPHPPRSKSKKFGVDASVEQGAVSGSERADRER